MKLNILKTAGVLALALVLSNCGSDKKNDPHFIKVGVATGPELKVAEAAKKVAKEKIDLIIQYMERNGHLSENYFEQILGGDDAETIDNFIDKNPNDVLVF